MSLAEQIATLLVEQGAVVVSPDKPFRWASGLLSPIYCDNRLLISHVDARETIADAFVETIETLQWCPDVIAGTATAGIPHAAWVAHKMRLPMVYVRASSKQHGKQNQIEGRISAGQRVVLIEDLISTGGSSIKAAQVLQSAGCVLPGVLAIFEYGMERANDAFKKADINRRALSGLNTLTKVLQTRAQLSEQQALTVAHWRSNPSAWSKSAEVNASLSSPEL